MTEMNKIYESRIYPVADRTSFIKQKSEIKIN
jgi:hypothetical protein